MRARAQQSRARGSERCARGRHILDQHQCVDVCHQRCLVSLVRRGNRLSGESMLVVRCMFSCCIFASSHARALFAQSGLLDLSVNIALVLAFVACIFSLADSGAFVATATVGESALGESALGESAALGEPAALSSVMTSALGTWSLTNLLWSMFGRMLLGHSLISRTTARNARQKTRTNETNALCFLAPFCFQWSMIGFWRSSRASPSIATIGARRSLRRSAPFSAFCPGKKRRRANEQTTSTTRSCFRSSQLISWMIWAFVWRIDGVLGVRVEVCCARNVTLSFVAQNHALAVLCVCAADDWPLAAQSRRRENRTGASTAGASRALTPPPSAGEALLDVVVDRADGDGVYAERETRGNKRAVFLFAP